MRQRSILILLAGLVAVNVSFSAPGASATPSVASSITPTSVGDLGAITDVFEPDHDVVAAEVASNGNGYRVVGFIQRTDTGFDVKVSTSSTMDGPWAGFTTVAQLSSGLGTPDVEVTIGANRVATVVWTDADNLRISGTWNSVSSPEWATSQVLMSGYTNISYLDVGPLANSALVVARGFDTAISAQRVLAIDWAQSSSTPPFVDDLSAGNNKTVREVAMVSDGDDDVLVAWDQDLSSSTTDAVWGNVWDGTSWNGRQQLSTSTGSTVLSSLAVGHAENRMIVGWWESTTTIIIDYFDPITDAWNAGTLTLQSGLNTSGITKDLVILADPNVADGLVLWTEKDGTKTRHRGLIAGSAGPGSPFWVSNSTDNVFNSSGALRDNGMVGAMESDGDATVMWRYGGYSTTVIRFTRTGSGTGTWGTEVTYGGSAGYEVPGHGSFGATGGATSQTIWVVAGESTVKFLGTTTWSGTTLTTPTAMTDHTGFDAYGSLSLGLTPAGDTLAVWVDSSEENIVYSTKSATSSSWASPTTLTEAYRIRGLRLVQNSAGGVVILWTENSTVSSPLVLRTSAWNRSTGWTAVSSISSAPVNPTCLATTMTSAGSGIVTFSDGLDPTKLYAATFDADGNTNSAALIATDSSGRFSCSGTGPEFDVVLSDDGRFMVAFDASNGVGVEVYTVEGNLASPTVATPTLRSPTATATLEYFLPTLALAPNGSVAIAWSEYDATSSQESQTLLIGTVSGTFGAPIGFDVTTSTLYVERLDAEFLSDGSLVLTAILNGGQYDIWAARLPAGSSTVTSRLLASDVYYPLAVAHDSTSFNILHQAVGDLSIDYHRFVVGASDWATTDVVTPSAGVTGTFAVGVNGSSDAIGWILDNESTTWPQVATRSVTGLITLTPQRIINTRPTGKIGNRTGTADPMIFNVYGQGGLPGSGIGAVLLNVTVVDPEVGDEGGYLTVYPCASGRPDASNLNFVSRQIIPNTVIAPVDPSGNICFYSYGRTHVLADVSGYFPR